MEVSNMSKLIKSLQDLDAAADELIAKSMEAKKDNSEEAAQAKAGDSKEEPEVSPEEIVKDTTKSDEEDEEAEEDAEAKEKEEKEAPGQEPSVEKSESEDDDDEITEEIQKSFAVPGVEQAFEVSEFLSAITEAITGSLSVVGGQIKKSMNTNETVYNALAKSVRAIAQSNSQVMEQQRITQNLCKSMMSKFEEINAKLDTIGAQPMTRKSVAGIVPIQKSFDTSAGNTAGAQLSKSQVMSILNDELYKGNPNVSASDIISYESGAPLRPEVQDLVMNKSRQ